MLIWMCAMHCEAKPVIDFYRLKKSTEHRPFDVYLGEQQACVVSGIGQLNMAAATAWVAALFNPQQPLCWINLGIAGHADLEQGSLIVANKVTTTDPASAIYPVPIVKHKLLCAPLQMQSFENRDYDSHQLYDMESYAFLRTASHFSPLELCQCLKVVSDNQATPPTRNKADISQLIHHNIEAIDAYAQKFKLIRDEYSVQQAAVEYMQSFLALAHFTTTQQIQLGKILLGLQSFDPGLETSLDSIRQLHQSKKILASLEQTLQQHSEQF